MGPVWYATRFPTVADWQGRRVMLRFDAVTYRATVFLNGVELGGHEGGYTPFEFEITPHLCAGDENLLAVRVDQQLSAETVPQGNLAAVAVAGQIAGQHPDVAFDFFPYSGIHRPVTIYTTAPEGYLETLRLETKIDGANGVVAFCGECRGAQAVTLRVAVTETGATCDVPISEGAFRGTLRIPDVKLWGPGAPHLYHLKCQVLANAGEMLDEYRQRFGVREIRVTQDQFLINGQPFHFQGFGKHEDFPVIGKGLCEAVTIRDFELMRWLNANSFRTTHYPYAEETLDLADEYGFVVISETPAVGINFEHATATTLAKHLQALEELIARDRNHPSVVMWSVSNEPTSADPKARPYFQKIAARARALDPTRPITLVSCFWWDDQAMEYFDVCSLNTYPGWYTLAGRLAQAEEKMRAALTCCREKYGKPVLVAEFGADTLAGCHGLPSELWTEEYQKELILRLIDVMRACDFCIGEHIWNFADFKTAQHHLRAFGNRKGVFTRDRQPKLVAHFLKEKWAPNR